MVSVVSRKEGSILPVMFGVRPCSHGPLTATELLTLEELLQDVRMSDGLCKFRHREPLTAHSQLVDSAFILGSYLGSNAVPQSPLHVLRILVDKFCLKTSCTNFYLKHVRFMACLANEPVHPCASVASSSKIFV